MKIHCFFSLFQYILKKTNQIWTNEIIYFVEVWDLEFPKSSSKIVE